MNYNYIKYTIPILTIVIVLFTSGKDPMFLSWHIIGLYACVILLSISNIINTKINNELSYIKNKQLYPDLERLEV